MRELCIRVIINLSSTQEDIEIVLSLDITWIYTVTGAVVATGKIAVVSVFMCLSVMTKAAEAYDPHIYDCIEDVDAYAYAVPPNTATMSASNALLQVV